MIINTVISRRAVAGFFSQLNVLICNAYRGVIPIVKYRLLTETQCGQVLKRWLTKTQCGQLLVSMP
jgi:hypothetical protein